MKKDIQNKLFTREQLIKLIAPLIVEQLLVLFVGMLDTLMVSHAGEAAVSGVSIVNEVNYLIITILTALSAGGAVVVSQYIGNNNQDKAGLAASQMMMISTATGLVMMGISVIFCKQILNLLYGSVEKEVMKNAVTYFYITALSFPFLGIYNSASAIYRSMNETKQIMYVSIIMNIMNMTGNAIGVYGLHLAAAGVAWPTLISRMTAALLLGTRTFYKGNLIHVDMRQLFSIHKDMIHKILKIAVPNAIENGLFQFGRIIVTIFIAAYGTSEIAANGVADSLTNLALVTAGAMQLAIVTVIGQCTGAGDYDQAEYYFKKLLIWSYILAAVNCFIVFLILPVTIQLYSLSEETAEIVRQLMLTYLIADVLIEPLAFVLPNGLRAAGDARFTMITGVLSMFIVRISLAYVLGTVMHMHVLGVYLAMYCDWIVRMICFVIRYKSGKWKAYRLV